MAIDESSVLPLGVVLPLSNAAGEFLLPEAAPSQDPYAAQRAQTEAALKQAYEAGPAAYKAEESKLSALHLPWFLDLSRIATGALGLLLILGAMLAPTAARAAKKLP